MAICCPFCCCCCFGRIQCPEPLAFAAAPHHTDSFAGFHLIDPGSAVVDQTGLGSFAVEVVCVVPILPQQQTLPVLGQQQK